MSPEDRKHFDRVLERVVKRLPQVVLDLMEEVPLIVEDFPSLQLRKELKLTELDALCGLYYGVSKAEPEFEPARMHSDQVFLFREGIMSEAADDEGLIT